MEEREGEERRELRIWKKETYLQSKTKMRKKVKKEKVLVKKGPFVVYFRNDATQTNLCIFIFCN